MAGVSQRTESHSDSDVAEAGAPLIRTWRRSGAAGDGAGADLHIAKPGRHREAAAAAAARHFGQGRAAQPAPRREQRHRLEHVGLARPVLAGEHDEARPRREQGVAMVAEVGEDEAGEGHRPSPSGTAARGTEACHPGASRDLSGVRGSAGLPEVPAFAGMTGAQIPFSPASASRFCACAVADRLGDSQPRPRRFQRLRHQRLIILAMEPGGALAVAPAFPDRPGEGGVAGDAKALESRAGADEGPAEAAGLGVRESDQAGLAERLVGLVAGQDVPDVVDVALAPAEPGVRMLDIGRDLGLGDADLGQAVGRIAGPVEEGAIGGADAAFREGIDPGAVAQAGGELDPLVGQPPALARSRSAAGSCGGRCRRSAPA